MPSDRSSVEALKNILSEVDLLISTTDPLPQNRTPRCQELLRAALALANDLGKQSSSAAVIMGRKGGSSTARKGSDYFRELAAKRKINAGGRPRKES